MRNFSKGLVRAKASYLLLSPSYPACFKETRLIRILFSSLKWGKFVKNIISAGGFDGVVKHVSKTFANGLVSGIQQSCIRPLYIKAAATGWRPMFKKNGIGGRSWIINPTQDQRVIKQMRVMFHDANKAGKHIDIHIGDFSMVINITGKPIADKLKFNAKGELTIKSKLNLVDLLREEVKNNSRVIQNVDHSVTNAQASWMTGEIGVDGYGSGKTRQEVFTEPIEVMSVKDGPGKTIKIYSPTLSKNSLLYIHKLYKGDGKKPPVLIFGTIKRHAPEFEDKLHLKPTRTINEFIKKIDVTTTTQKYDGASANFDSKEGETTFWSPRFNKNNERIQYSGKVPELFRIKPNVPAQGMGELMFVNSFGKYMTAAEIGGILNSNQLRPIDVTPEFRTYRMDSWNGVKVVRVPFFLNRKLQIEFSKLSKFVKPALLVCPMISPRLEGLVAVKAGDNILNGYKIIFWGDTDDWEIESVSLGFGPTGRTAGVVWFKSLTSGRKFKLGPGQLGTEDFVRGIMKRSDEVIGMVAKVRSRGFEGRSAKFVEWHVDKGVG